MTTKTRITHRVAESSAETALRMDGFNAQGFDRAANARFQRMVLTNTIESASNFEALDLQAQHIWHACEEAINTANEQILIRTIIALQPYLLARGLYRLGLKLATHAAKLAQKHSTKNNWAELLWGAASYAFYLREIPLARRMLKRSLLLATASHNHHLRVRCLILIGSICAHYGQYQKAADTLEIGLALARTRDILEPLPEIHLNLASAYRNLNDAERSKKHNDLGLKTAAEQNNHGLYAYSLLAAGAQAGAQGQLDVAEQLITDGLNIARQHRIQNLMGAGLRNMANLHAVRGNIDKAKECLQEGLLLTREMGHISSRIAILITYGVAVSLGDKPDTKLAMEYWREGLSCASLIGQYEQETLLLCNLAEGHLRFGELEIARTYIDRALKLARKLGSAWEVGSTNFQLGQYCLKVKQPVRAKRAFGTVLRVGIQANYPEIIADARFGLGQCEFLFGRKSKGLRLICQALSEHLQAQNSRSEEIVEWMRQNDVTCPD